MRFLFINDHFDKSKLSFLTVALTFFRITVALIFGKLVPKVTKPYLGSISSSNLYDLRVDNAKNDCQHVYLYFTAGPFLVKLPPEKIFTKIFIAPKVSY